MVTLFFIGVFIVLITRVLIKKLHKIFSVFLAVLFTFSGFCVLLLLQRSFLFHP